MELGGISSGKAFDLSTLILGLMVIGDMAGCIFVEWIGRRGTVLYGVAFQCRPSHRYLVLYQCQECNSRPGRSDGCVGILFVPTLEPMICHANPKQFIKPPLGQLHGLSRLKI